MKQIIKILLAGIILIIPLNMSAQERLIPLKFNPVIKKSKKPVEKSDNSEVLELPFIDDFSGTEVIPSPAFWEDKWVYINNSWAIAPPTYGVASLDAIDTSGTVYEHDGSDPFIADLLSSKAINLDYMTDTAIYLSFYYQAQGYIDVPEEQDSLVLDFYAPEQKQWSSVWSTPGTFTHDFKLVMLKIDQPKYLKNGFKFRFKNYVSYPKSNEESLMGNIDQWHIDYVYLDRNRAYNDTIFNDIAFLDHTGSVLLNWESVPISHFLNHYQEEVTTTFPMSIHNLKNENVALRPEIEIIDLLNGQSVYNRELTDEEVYPLEILNYESSFNYNFTSDYTDSAHYQIITRLNPVIGDMIPGNDEVVYEQIFSDYYAHDDGNAEYGYGIVGEGTQNASVAYKFRSYEPNDSLIGFSIYFNQSYQDASKKYFQLAVWAEEEDHPGELLYTQLGGIPEYSDQLNEFNFYKLDTVQLVPRNFYIGYIKTTTDFLNVGFDRNNNHKDKIFYNIYGDWTSSSIDGSLMIRPVFQNYKSSKSGVKDISDNRRPQTGIYPNPTTGILNIEMSETIKRSNPEICILSIDGKIVRRFGQIQGKIDLSDLEKGVYFLRISNNNAFNEVQKIIISH